MRNWKQHWDVRKNPNAPLIWIRSVTFGGVRTQRGDPVTDEQRAKMSAHRMQLWWNAGYFALAEGPAAVLKIPHRDIPDVEWGEPDGEAV